MAASSASSTGGRVASIDVARFFGICLVFYGHLIEQVMYLDNAAAAAQYKWVYSFHMPLFFLLAGFVASDARIRAGVAAFLKRRWRNRVVPYLFFSALVGALALALPGWFPTLDLSSAGGFRDGVVSTLLGFPAFNIPLWFIAALVGVEIVHFLLARFWTSQWRLAAAALGFYLAGYFLNLHVNFFEAGLSIWMLNLVPLGYAFYLLGIALRRSGWMSRPAPRWQLALLALGCLAGVFLTYDLNNGPFRMLDAVVLLAGAPGHVLWFPVTALLGIALVLLVARLMPAWRWLQYLGEITLVIYGLHGLFYHFVNPPLAGWMAAVLPADGGSMFVAATLLTLLSVASVVPLAMLLRRYLPAVVGGLAGPRAEALSARPGEAGAR